MDIMIIGGGIGGLTLALAVHAAGAAGRIRILEAAADVRALGVGINLGPHAVKELSALGLEEALVAVACTPQDYAFFTRHGQLVGSHGDSLPAIAGPTFPFIAAICTRCCSTPCATGSGRRISSAAIAASAWSRTIDASRRISAARTAPRWRRRRAK